MIYYGTRLSENISRREPEGYLLCLNVPVARTGTQEYLSGELGFPPSPDPIPVYRPEAEVFSPETIASFEGMPVTNDHPPGGVTVGNIRTLQKGHAHNIRRGSGSESDLLLADLIITDTSLIDAILAGKREISCGYTYELCEENGQYIQRKIRGNHVAVVNAGRAGSRVSIKDGYPPSRDTRLSERRKPTMKKSLLKKLTSMARDGDPEAIEALAEAVEQIVENPSDTPENVVAAAVSESVPADEPRDPAEETASVTADDDMLAAILDRLDQLIALLAPVAPAGANDDDPDPLPEQLAEVVEEAVEAVSEENAPLPEEIASIVEEVIGNSTESSGVLEPGAEEEDECGGQECIPAADVLRAAFAAVRPELKKMPRRDRNRICADIARRLKHTGKDSRVYNALAASGARKTMNYSDLARKIMASRNPCFK